MKRSLNNRAGLLTWYCVCGVPDVATSVASHQDAGKRQVQDASVINRLLYGLQAAWLIKAARARLDGFHAKCLRQIFGIALSYFSRISNKALLQAMRGHSRAHPHIRALSKTTQHYVYLYNTVLNEQRGAPSTQGRPQKPLMPCICFERMQLVEATREDAALQCAVKNKCTMRFNRPNVSACQICTSM